MNYSIEALLTDWAREIAARHDISAAARQLALVVMPHCVAGPCAEPMGSLADRAGLTELSGRLALVELEIAGVLIVQPSFRGRQLMPARNRQPVIGMAMAA